MINTITTGKINQNTFEIVEEIPSNFFVWNIGKNMGTDEYIPLCESLEPGNKKCFSINTQTLKAIHLPCEEVRLLRDAAHYGVNSLKTCHSAIKSKRTSVIAEAKRKYAYATLAIFEKISY